jgi:Ni/Co efflux regulator RcnB
MNKLLIGALALSLVGASVATAQPYDNGASPQHPGWGQDYGNGHRWGEGERMGYNDWHNAQAVDYRQHNLRQPPDGYEWRESGGQYVLAAVATGVIASIILDGGH